MRVDVNERFGAMYMPLPELEAVLSTTHTRPEIVWER
jgi:hypothetical protein